MPLSFTSALAAFGGHLLISVVLSAAFIAIYAWLTPHEEMRLIRAGNTAAALGLMGAVLGFAIVLARAVSISNDIGETIVWGIIALAVQIIGHYLLRLFLPKLHLEIEQGSYTAATLTAGTGIALGLLNAASMTP